MSRSCPGAARNCEKSRVRANVLRLLPAVLAPAIGCSPLSGGSGCEAPPRATDAVATGVVIQNHAPPCASSNEGVRGSEGHLYGVVDCPGESEPFLVAVRVDGKLASLVETRGAGFGSQVTVDGGPWEAGATLWHPVELIVDPLNLFRESNEGNNRFAGQVRTIAPDIGINPYATRFLVAYQEVTQVVAGTVVRVDASANPMGRYRSFELSARSGTDLSVADTLGVLVCDPYAGAPIRSWDWTPPGPGTYSVEFRVTPLSGEPDRDPSNNILIRTLTVVPPGAVPPGRAPRSW